MPISIHTPVKGVTYTGLRDQRPQSISIHTPVKGVTGRAGAAAQRQLISIHTPVKGVTLESVHIIRGDAAFQSTHP